MPPGGSTRWCPTPEQLMLLEEMYRSGLRTPNASQIQQITAHLSYYGRIEGKNVFYWFQNHKARDRQKLRRRLRQHHQLLHHPPSLIYPPLQYNILAEASRPHAPQLIRHQTSPHFFHQGCYQDSTEGLNLLSALETSSREEEIAVATASTTYGTGYEWMEIVDGDHSASVPPRSCRPLKTLDLFPTKSTGLRGDYYHTSKSASSLAPLPPTKHSLSLAL